MIFGRHVTLILDVLAVVFALPVLLVANLIRQLKFALVCTYQQTKILYILFWKTYFP